MRQKIIAGNWKMNLNHDEAEKLLKYIIQAKPTVHESLQLNIAPPFVYLHEFSELIKDIPFITLSAQNVNGHSNGAFTGEISVEMLQSININSCIIGHSERRELFGENLIMIQKKIYHALENNMNVILAVGEKREIRENGKQKEFVLAQIDSALIHYEDEFIDRLVIAYEPIWAIGTGVTAKPEDAQKMHKAIRIHLNDNYQGLGNNISILYGGSVKPENAESLFVQEDIDGALIGGASLDGESFVKIIETMENILE